MNTLIPPITRITGKIIEIGFLFLIVVTPLAFGSTPGWAFVGMVVVVAIIVVSFLLYSRSLSGIDNGTIPGSGGGGGIIFLKVVFLILILGVIIQLIPLPGAIIKLISPVTYKFHQLSGELSSSGWQTISLYPSRTGEALVGMIIYGAVVWVIFRYRPVDKSKAVFITRLILTAIITGFFISILGIIQKYSGQTRIYGMVTISTANFFGPYINRNHFAGYIEMVIPLALSILIFLSSGRLSSRSRSIRERIVESDPRWFLFLFVSLVMIVAHISTRSRGGMLTLIISMVYFVYFVRKLKLVSRGTILRLIAAILILILLIIGYFGYEPIIERLGVFSSKGRVMTWRDTWSLFKSYPILGTGLGTFREVFQNLYGEYRTYQRRHPFYYNVYPYHAENEYLQLMAEMGLWGLIGGLLLIGRYFIYIFSWQPRRRKKNNNFKFPGKKKFELGKRAIVLGASTGVVALLVHGLIDFNFHIPANALLFSILAGVSLSIVMEARPDPDSDRVKKDR
ncbi:MAG: O-antigen ligase family protein [Candidatus Auribacterota bacterium]|nr:O-antigen ligase family protein [Candidatus Auribacterota bacterium]